ncbi:MAG TPA: hypothetical protein VF339_07415 [Gammaproteobacteria bacterium]
MRSSGRASKAPQRAALVLVAAACVPLPAVAQPGASADGSDGVPRTADGRPDLSGIWIATGALGLLEGAEVVQAARAADREAGRTLPPTEPPPYKPEAEALRQRYLDRQGIDDPMARCLLSGVPRINTRPLPFEIVQLPDRVIMLYEVHHAFRIIPTDGRAHPEDLKPTYLGDSVGRWEGDTLVVEVVGFNDDTWLAGTGTHHSDQMRVVERYTRDSAETILYEAVIEDPVVFEKPWRMHEIFRLRPNERIREYECIESNEDLVRFEELLRSGEIASPSN